MSFFDDLAKMATDFGEKAAQKTQQISGVAKLTAQAAEEERKLNNVYAQIGKLYVGGDTDALNDLVSAAREAEEKIAALRKEINVLKNVRVCASCGAEISPTAVFCSHCGAEQPREEYDGPKCSVCGAHLTPDQRFCTVCGKAVETGPVEEAPEVVYAPAPEAPEATAETPAEAPEATVETPAEAPEETTAEYL